ncbi:MAG: hypothetical protein GXX84_01110 [Acidobacteria bacterium]|nr:hypothetical protein [Acidobacteriota bacterium]
MQETILIVFTGILAIAVLIQTILFFGMYRAIRQMTVWMDGMSKDLLRNVELVSSRVEEAVTAIRSVADGIKPIQEKLTVTSDLVSRRAADLDDFLAEATATARREMRHIQDTVHLATTKVEQTIELVHSSILAPLNEASAITRAVRVGLDVLFRRGKNRSATAQDEEMFI